MKKYKTFIFDLDGTLLDTLDDLASAVNYAMQAKNYPACSKGTVSKNLGHGVRHLISYCLPEGLDQDLVEESLSVFRAYYSIHDKDETKLFPGMKETLEELKRRKIAMAIVSNKFHGAVLDLRQHYFDGLIDHAVGESAEHAKKPAPDLVLASMELLEADPADTVYIGDSEVDAETAENAGLDCLLCQWGLRSRAQLERETAVGILTRPEELLAYAM